MMYKIKNHIICGFPGVGKSSASKINEDVADIESSEFRWPVEWKNVDELDQMKHERKLNQNWVRDYVDHIEAMASQYGYNYCLISCHKEVREELNARNIPYMIVVPDRSLKDEYLVRYLIRGDSFAFIDCINKHWDEWLSEIDKSDVPVIHLSTGQFIGDILPLKKD